MSSESKGRRGVWARLVWAGVVAGKVDRLLSEGLGPLEVEQRAPNGGGRVGAVLGQGHAGPGGVEG
eukprot:8233335-Lingulodinium_polyedra.AAC.1